MKRPVVLRTAARLEFDLSANWYDERQHGLGNRFKAAVDRVIERISELPEFYGLTHDGIREAKVLGFPFCIYYREEAGRIVIYAIFHASRNPSTWQDRAE